MDEISAKLSLETLFLKGVSFADPINCVPALLPKKPKGRVLVVAAGKAASSMANAVEETWGHDIEGIAVTRYGHVKPCKSIEVIEAAHPIPDDRGEIAAKRLIDEAKQLGEDDLLLCLISGGGSSLLGLPAGGLSFDDKKAINKALLMSGAPIGEMNIVRKHLSAIKGGRLAKAAYPAHVFTIAISDVPGDDPSVIASGPTVPDKSTLSQAIEIIDKYQIFIPHHVRIHLENPSKETPKPGDQIFEKCETVIAARPIEMVNHVVKEAEKLGYNVINLGTDIEGEASEVGAEHAQMALTYKNKVEPDHAPIAIISGGETTVTVKNQNGRGGRNCEYALSLAANLKGASNIFAFAGDTDGIDGSEDNCGAFVLPDTLDRADGLGISAQKMLDDNESYSFFSSLGDLFVTGPTLTNVNDLRIILVLP